MNDDALQDLIRLLDVDNFIKLTTIPCRKSEYTRSSTPIVEPESSQWNFHTLSIILNELKGWKPDPKNGCRKQTRLNGTYYFYFKYINEEDAKFYFIINYDTQISVKFSKPFVNTWHNEEVKENWIQKSYTLNTSSDGSHALLINTPLFFYPQSYFSELFKYFVFSFISMLMSPYSIETMQIYEYYDCFIAKQRYETLDLDHFLQTNEGFLKLKVIKYHNTRKNLVQLKSKKTVIM